MTIQKTVRVPTWAKEAAKNYVQELWAPSARIFKARQKKILATVIAECYANAMRK